ncbi:MAG TPA: hypothetical protein PKH07_11015, partial [bacterium]|nr:hypothetical protein [bacterium]
MNHLKCVCMLVLVVVCPTPAFCQPEPLAEGMISWEDFREFPIGSLIPISNGMENECPTVAVDRKGTVWVAWIREVADGDQVWLK